MEISVITIYGVKDGKLPEEWELLDIWGLYRQLGPLEYGDMSNIPHRSE